jgi:hypothetical protein
MRPRLHLRRRPRSCRLDGVASLLDKSLVRLALGADGQPRYTTLETVHEYGLEQVTAAGEEPATRARHAEFYEALVQRAVPHFCVAEQLTWLACIDDELDNLRVVLQWLLDHDQHERGQLLAGSLWYFWSIHSRVSEGREWLMRVLAAPTGKTTARTRARALFALGLILTRQYNLVAAIAAFIASIDLARQADGAWTTAMALARSAWTAFLARKWSVSLQPEIAGAPKRARPGPSGELPRGAVHLSTARR